MKKEVIIVPEGKCPMDALAELGTRTRFSWIYLHNDAVEEMKKTCDSKVNRGSKNISTFHWKETRDYPATQISVDLSQENLDWNFVVNIIAYDINFIIPSPDPEEIFFLKMEK